VFRSTSLRLAALYTAAFALSVIVLGAVTLMSTRASLEQQFNARIQAEAAALAQEFRTEGLTGVLQAVRERDQTPGALDYGLDAPDGRPLAGRLAGRRTSLGWSSLRAPTRSEEAESIRALTTGLPGGYRLVVGDDNDRSESLQQTVVRSFAFAFAGVVLLGFLGGFGLSRDVHRRLTAISGTAQAIIDGDLARRVPVRGGQDDLDRLALTINRMLDRIGVLMRSLHQVSDDIAHDLRTPLTRLRQRLEGARGLPALRMEEAIEGALQDLDGILDTFAALLRIAQIQAGARRAGFRPVDLVDLGRTVVEAFAPSAEDAGQALILEVDQPLSVVGDPELLTQMLVNLVENAMRHAGPKAHIRVRVAQAHGGGLLSVLDDGPGVPEAERERLFDRFYRLERSRSTPGSGLGLSLAAAVAGLHGAEIQLLDVHPGLEARVTFPLPTLGFPNDADS
jgi:signal transduction histidine kinase